jgi:hypothetical protein
LAFICGDFLRQLDSWRRIHTVSKRRLLYQGALFVSKEVTRASTCSADSPSSSTCLSTPLSGFDKQIISGLRGHLEHQKHSPKRAKALAGVPWASRMRTGRSGLFFLMTGYAERMKCLQNGAVTASDSPRERACVTLCQLKHCLSGSRAV